MALDPNAPLRPYSNIRSYNSQQNVGVIMAERMDVEDSFQAQTPIIENMVVGVPPVFEGLTRQLDKIVEQPLLGPKTSFPLGQPFTT